MLVLSRKQGEEIVIGNVRVVVVDIDRGKVRLGIEAPREVRVDRGEIHALRQQFQDPAAGQIAQAQPEEKAA